MSAEFSKALTAEIASLEAELDADPRFKKLARLRELRSLYDAERGVVGTVAAKEQPDGVAIRANRGGRRMAPERARAIELVREALNVRTVPLPTAALLDYLALNGVTLGGEDKLSNLSALLYNTTGFKSHGRAGWLLDPPPTETEAHKATLIKNKAADDPSSAAPISQQVNPLAAGSHQSDPVKGQERQVVHGDNLVS